MISAERLVELRAKVKKEMARRSCVEHGSSASMNKFAANYDYNAVPVTGGDITDEHIQKVIDPLLNVADFLQDNSLQQSHSGADVIVDQAEKFVDTLAKIDKQASDSGCRGLCTGLCVGSCTCLLYTSVVINMNPVFNINGNSGNDTVNTIKEKLKELINEMSGELATRLLESYANMPT